MRVVLLTRPLLLASPSITTLRQLGYGVFHEPLLTIQPLASPRPSFASQPLIIITSRVVFDVLSSRKEAVEAFLSCPCYCVGEKTAQAARAFGFIDIRRAVIDSQELARCLIRQEAKTRPILHIGGEDREAAFYAMLRDAGWSDIRVWRVYKAETTQALSQELMSLLSHHKFDAALFYSARTAGIFAELISQNKLEPCCSRLTAIGLSPSVLLPLSRLSFQAVLTAKAPTETDLMTCLATHVPL